MSKVNRLISPALIVFLSLALTESAGAITLSECLLKLKPWVERFRDVEMAQEEEVPTTKIYVSSMSYSPDAVALLGGLKAYEDRALPGALADLVRRPKEKLVFVTSEAVDPSITEYYFDLFSGGDKAKKRSLKRRVRFFSLEDSRLIPLTTKLLQKPEAVAEIKLVAGNSSVTYLDYTMSTKSEYELAELFGLPFFGSPINQDFESKTQFHKVAREAEVPVTDARVGIKSEPQLAESVRYFLKKSHNSHEDMRTLTKHNDGVGGDGNAILSLVEPSAHLSLDDQSLIQVIKENLQDVYPEWTSEQYLSRLYAVGGVVEEFIKGIVTDENGHPKSPSAQMDLFTDHIKIVGLHMQRLSLQSASVFDGAIYPAPSKFQKQMLEIMRKVGEVLRAKGILGRVAGDFLVVRDEKTGEESVILVELNIRRGGTHPVDVLPALTKGHLKNHLWHALHPVLGEVPLMYESTDNFKHPGLKTFSSDAEMMRFLLSERFRPYLFNESNHEGVVYHMLGDGWKSEAKYGKIGFSFYGHSSLDRTRNKYSQFRDELSKALQERLERLDIAI